MWVDDLFGVKKPVIGLVHLKALPGTPLYDAVGGMRAIIEAASRDLSALQSGGVDGVLFCNENDRPYLFKVDPVVVAAMATVISTLRPDIRVPFGVDILWDPVAAIGVAQATGAQFVREVFTGTFASDMGFWNTAAGEALRYRRLIEAKSVYLFFNVNAEFAHTLDSRTVGEIAQSVEFSSIPDAICISGSRTGIPPHVDDLLAAKKNLPGFPVFVNTGARHDNVAELLSVADGIFVGSSLKINGITWNPVDPERVHTFMRIVRNFRADQRDT